MVSSGVNGGVGSVEAFEAGIGIDAIPGGRVKESGEEERSLELLSGVNG